MNLLMMKRTSRLQIFVKRLFWLCGSTLLLSGICGSAANFTVTTSGLQFSPPSISVNVGDTITWNNLFSHTVTGNSANEPFCGSSSPAGGTCSVTFNVAGAFTYRCIPHASFSMTGLVIVASAGAAPTVSITNPPNNALLAAPAALTVGVVATDSDGNVANVQLLTNGVAGPTDAASPFTFTLSNLVAGNYVLRARATDNSALSATSAPVNVRVVERPALTLTRSSNGPIDLQVSTITGVSYVIEQSSVLTNFTSISTNAGNGSVLHFSETNGSSQSFFRVRLQ